jgi:hypothetical protein
MAKRQLSDGKGHQCGHIGKRRTTGRQCSKTQVNAIGGGGRERRRTIFNLQRNHAAELAMRKTRCHEM